MKTGSIKLLFVLCGMVLAGCAAPGMNVTVGYTPVVTASGGSGELYLVQDIAPQVSQKALWVIGEVKDSGGARDHDLVISSMPADFIAGILADELTGAGYVVRQTKSMPEQAVRAVRISSVKLYLDETLGVLNYRLDATASVALGLELWNRGSRLQSYDFRASYSDSDYKEGDLLGSLILRNAIRDVMKQAVPDIVKNLDKK